VLAQVGQVTGWGYNFWGHAGWGESTSLLTYASIEAGYGVRSYAVRADGTVACLQSYGPCDVPLDLDSVKQVAGGVYHTVALLADGSLKAWGDNFEGQLNVPGDLGPVSMLDAGADHTIALRLDGQVRCWGKNDKGQCSPPPQAGTIVRVAAGYNHSLAINAAGAVIAWGDNQGGACSVPPLPAPAVEVTGGAYFSAARLADGSVVCWGGNSWGECTPPGGLGSVTSISAGWAHCAAVRPDGTVACWGRNSAQQCDVPPLASPAVSVNAGSDGCIALLQDGSVVTWGSVSPPPASLLSVSKVATSYDHSMALLEDGSVRCWGNPASGRTTVPAGLGGVVEIAAGSSHSVARTASGAVVCWGANWHGQTSVPFDLGNCIAIDAGENFTTAVRTNGSAACWGSNGYGQCNVPAALPPLVDVAAGQQHVVASSAGSVHGWGDSAFGQANPPSDLGSIVDLDAGAYHNIALRPNGSVRCWGLNGSGQTTVPAGLSSVIQVAAGAAHSVALRADGSVVCWGWNNEGQTTVPPGLGRANQIAAGGWTTLALLSPSASSCTNPGGGGTATLVTSGASWQNVGIWSWSNGGGPQVPGELTDVRLGAYGSVGSTCDARASTLVSSSGSTLLVPVDLSQPMSSQDHSIDVGGMATMAGRVWLLASGAGVLPADLDVGVLRSGSPVGTFDIVQTNVPPPAGKFLALVPVAGLVGTEYRLRLLDLPGGGTLSGASAGPFAGAAIAAETMDYDQDGFDDLAIAIDFGPSQPGKLQVLLNDGSGNLGLVSVQVDTLPQPTCLATGDVDCDGRDDAVVGTVSGSAARVFLNNSPGSPAFTLGAQILPGGLPSSVVVLKGCASALPVLTNVAVGTSAGGTGPSMVFAEGLTGTVVQSLPLSAQPVSTAPVAGGRRIATGGTSTSTFDGESLLSTEPGRVLVLAESSTGSWSVVQTIPVPGKPVSVDSSDIDGDGNPEIVTANADPVLQGTGSALPVLTLFRGSASAFGNAVPIAPSGASSGLDVSLVDIDGDGDRDLVSVQRMTGTVSKAVSIRIDTAGPGGALTLGTETDLGADNPILCDRGNLDGTGGEDLYLVDDSGTSLLGTTASARPYLGADTTPACPGDLTADGVVDGQDLGLLLSSWNGDGPADLNRDGTVDGQDLGLMLSAWGDCPAE
jgi:alpha-tubulin suppressor-like RCC1 family protein